MVTAKHDLACIETNITSYIFHKSNKISWLHTSITTVLVDLIAGGLDRDGAVPQLRELQAGPYCIRVCRTGRWDRGTMTCAIAGDDVT